VYAFLRTVALPPQGYRKMKSSSEQRLAQNCGDFLLKEGHMLTSSCPPLNLTEAAPAVYLLSPNAVIWVRTLL
jgi:hypothetical protein